ncbi:MAG: hypothetical protein M1814_002571 [Vezdaea aestivalis]|nr:MAG: hypothetical protein M1814_002571 [Vezdaea aestivalis]
MSNPNATCPCFNSTIDKPADCGVGAMVGGLIGVGASAGFALFAITAALLFRRAIRKSKVSGAVQERRIADTNIPNRTQHDSTNLEKGCDIGFGNNPVEGGLVDVDLHSPGKEFVATKRGMGKGGNRASVVSSVSSMRDYDSYDYCEGPSERNVDRWGSRRR